MKAHVVLAFLALVLLGPTPVRAAESVLPFRAETLPEGWRIEQDVVVPEAQLAGFGARLGGQVVSLTNQVVSVRGISVRVNAIVGAAVPDADAIERTMVGLRGADFVGRRERTVYEVASQNLLLARRVLAALGIGVDATATWEVAFRIALVDELDQTAGNRVFNHFLALEKGGNVQAAQRAIERDTQGWTFGTTLRLLTPGRGWSWVFDPEPVGQEAHGLVTLYRFEDPPRLEGVPYVDVEGRLTTGARFVSAGGAPLEGDAAERNLAATRFWPVDREPIDGFDRVIPEPPSLRALVAGCQQHVAAAVRYGGAVGTRDGVLEVLARGHGRCWDRSDVLVTELRRAGVPARQVAGWVPALGAGHVWVEAHVEGGWLPVDATTTWLGAGIDYLPFFATEDGHMPIVYLGMPSIRRVEADQTDDRPAR